MRITAHSFVFVTATMLSACKERTPELIPRVAEPTPVVLHDAGATSGDSSPTPTAIAIPTATATGPTGVIAGTVFLDGPMPAPEPLTVPPSSASNPGCRDAARRYALPFDVVTPGPFAGALVTAEARAPGLGEPVRRRIAVRDCDITPRYIFAKENDVVLLGLDSQRSHLPHVGGIGATIDQLLIRGQPDRELNFPNPGTFPVQMRDLPEFVGAMVYRMRQRFIETTDAVGHFRIADVPVGDVPVNAWYPGTVAARSIAAVRVGQTTTLEFHLRPAPRGRTPVEGIRHSDGTVRTDAGVIIPQ
jgi:hypothetical protein